MPTRRARGARARPPVPQALRGDGSCRCRAHPPARPRPTAPGRSRQARRSNTPHASARPTRCSAIETTFVRRASIDQGPAARKIRVFPGCRRADGASGSPPCPAYVLHHRHEAHECGVVFASFKGHDEPASPPGQRSPRAAPAGTRSGGPWTPQSEAEALGAAPVLCRRAHHRSQRQRSRHPMTEGRTPDDPVPRPARLAPSAPASSPSSSACRSSGLFCFCSIPAGRGRRSTYAELQDKVTAWLVVHLGMMIFIPLIAVVVLSALARCRGHRGADQPNSAGALRDLLQRLGGAARDRRRHSRRRGQWSPASRAGDGGRPGSRTSPRTSSLATSVCSAPSEASALIIAMIAAGVALRRHAGAPFAVAVLLGISGFLITVHPPPYGPTGLALFIVAVVLFTRSQSRSPAAAPLEQPRSA